VIGIHFGNGAFGTQGGGGGTAFYLFDAGTDGLGSIDINLTSSSGFVLYDTGMGGVIPEPATWTMLITGFAFVGASLRSRRAPAPARSLA
jgi:hypothetical protein